MSTVKSLSITDILSLLPHRFPFLLIDRVLGYREGHDLEAIKLVTANEHCMSSDSHYFPAVLIVEAMAQAAGVLAVLSAKDVSADSRFFLIGIDGNSFFRPVGIGEKLTIKIRVVRVTQGVGKFHAEAWVGDVQVAVAELMCAAQI